MLESIFSSVATTDTLSFEVAITTILASLVLGFVISLVYMFTHRKENYSKNFLITLIMLPAIISIIILLVGNNVARAFSLAGAFSLIRFRSAPGDPIDIAYVFLTLAIGLGVGIGYISYSILFTIILSLVLILIKVFNFAGNKKEYLRLKIVIPEDLNFENVFKDILLDNTNSYDLVKVKTTDFGALYELTYNIELKDNKSQKEFIDKIRVKNGNLLVSITKSEITEVKTF